MRKACKLDPEVKAISKDAVPLITKAVELFVGFLARKVAYTVSLRGVRSIREADLIQTIYMHESLEFMRIDFPRKPMNSLSKTPSMRHEVVPKHRVNVSQKTLESTVGVKAKADRLNAQVAPAGKSIAHFFGGSGVTSSAPATEAPPVDVVQSIGTVVVEEEKDRVAVAEGATAKEQSDAHSEVVLDEVVAEAAAESSMADVDVGQNDGARSELEA